MKRNDRLHALVETLRDASPQPCTGAELARRLAVSVRTIERDVTTLQRSGVPIWAAPGPMGGYTLDAGEALPPVDLTVAETAAIALALAVPATLPHAPAARTARAKLVAALSASAVEGAPDLGARLALLPTPGPVAPAVPRVIEQAVLDREVLELSYDPVADDPTATAIATEVEPLAFAAEGDDWYLVGWCRVRRRPAAFRLDRITAVRATGGPPPRRPEITGAVLADLVRRPARFAAGPR